MRILVVDDNEANRVLAGFALACPQWEIHVARSGQESLTMAELDRWDLILMDINMPGMNGVTAMKKIRQLPHCKNTAIAAFTADGNHASINRLLESGFTSAISKPLQVNALRDRVAQILQKNYPRSEGQRDVA